MLANRQTKHKDDWELNLRQVIGQLPPVFPSTTIVIKAAIHLIQHGLLHVPDTKTLNVKQGRALLYIACWLQGRMTAYWVDEGQLPKAILAEPEMQLWSDFAMVLIGPGGTGKTTVLKAAEALIDYFVGDESVRKCALSNTASRLLGGDTLHAMCKLPREDLQQKQSRLTGQVLRKHRARWKSAAALFIDEISMVAPDQLHQANIRVQQATHLHQVFGGLGTVLSGDFLQLPPIERGSLARRSENGGESMEEDKTRLENANEADVQKRNDKESETLQGLLLWRGLTRVVSLAVNIRAPGVLGRLQSEMRRGSISDDMWSVYLSRIVQSQDPRLQQSPFSTSDVQYIVHRHRLRTRQSFNNAVDHCQRNDLRLYVLKPTIEARLGEEKHLTATVISDLLTLSNPRKTGFIEGLLPLYIGARLLLQSKDCVRLGLMKGCECVLEQIIFDDAEVLPITAVAGMPIELEFLPYSLLLRAKSAKWILPAAQLPPLPQTFDRRGLFQLTTSSCYTRHEVGTKIFSTFKRTGFRVAPADTRIVYAAQGETFDAVIADMQLPPRMDPDTYWLASYVMLSRAKSLDGFLVLRPALRAALNKLPPAYLLREIDRLLALERTSIEALAKYMAALPAGVVPDDILAIFKPDAEQEEADIVQRVRAQHQAQSHVDAHGVLPVPMRPGAPSIDMSGHQQHPAKRRRLVGKQALPSTLSDSSENPGWSMGAIGAAAILASTLVSKRRRVEEGSELPKATECKESTSAATSPTIHRNVNIPADVLANHAIDITSSALHAPGDAGRTSVAESPIYCTSK